MTAMLATTEPPATSTDADLLAAVAGHDPAALGELVRRHVDLVYAAAVRQTRDRHVAEDVTQAVFLVLSRRAASVRGSALPAWLHQTTRYAAANATRSARRRRRHERAAARPEAAMPSAEPDPLLPLLDDAIASLGAKDRSAVIERYLRGRDLADVAAAIGASPHAAQKRIERAVGRLRRYFATRGGAVTTAAVAAVLAVAAPTPAPASVVAAAAFGRTPNAAALARGVQMMLTATKIKLTAAVLLTACVAGGGAGLGIAWAVNPAAVPPATLRPGPPAAPGRAVTATLGGGVTVTLLGVSESPSAGRPWWRPDGSPLPQPPYARLTNTVDLPGAGQLPREFAYETASPPYSASIRCILPAGSDWTEGLGEDAAGVGDTANPGLSAAVPNRPAVVRFDVAAGHYHSDLEAPGTGDAGGDIPGGVRRIGRTRPDGDGTLVDLTLADAGLPTGIFEMLVETDAGRAYGGSGVRVETSDPASAERTLKETLRFPVPPNRITSLTLRSRPFDRWVEFRNVSVQPGRPTAVQVVTSDTADKPVGPFPRLAPFSDLQWIDHRARIVVGGTPYTLVGLNGRSVADLVADARQWSGDLWQKRLAEDLVEVLDRTGRPPGATVTLWVRPVAGGPTRTLEDVPMTEENRRSVWERRQTRGDR